MELFLFIGPKGEKWIFPIQPNGRDNPEDQAWVNLADRLMGEHSFTTFPELVKHFRGNYFNWLRFLGKDYAIKQGWQSSILRKPFGDNCTYAMPSGI